MFFFKSLNWKSVRQWSKKPNIVPVRSAPPHWRLLRRLVPAFQWGGRANAVGNFKGGTNGDSLVACNKEEELWVVLCVLRGQPVYVRQRRHWPAFPRSQFKIHNFIYSCSSAGCVRVWILSEASRSCPAEEAFIRGTRDKRRICKKFDIWITSWKLNAKRPCLVFCIAATSDWLALFIFAFYEKNNSVSSRIQVENGNGNAINK